MPSSLAVLTNLSILLVVYHHLLYPPLLGLLARQRPAGPAEPPPRRYRDLPSDAALPRVTVLVPAFDEARVIAEKIRNLAMLDYPADRLRVVLACDGCGDDTAARARAAAAEPPCRHLALEVREYRPNRGKLFVLNEVLPTLEGDLVALTDASALISVDALLLAAEHFRSARTGVVCATYRLLEPGSAGEAAYWDYQVAVKEREAALGTPLGAHGAFYLFRPQLFRPLAPDTINDDFVLPMAIVLAGHGCVYEPRMVAVEAEGSSHRQDRRRRRRIAAGNLQQVLRMPRLLDPRRPGLCFAFASGKALRAVMPFLLVVSLAGSLALAPGSAWFGAAAAGQVLAYALALLRHATPGQAWPGPVESIHYLASGHLAGLVGATRYLVGLERRGWAGVARAAAGARRQDPPRPRDRRPRLHVHPLVAVGKRTVDVAVALAVLAFTAPLFPLVALAIRLDSPGPVLFRQLRIGESGPEQTRLFEIVKFRTMKVEVAFTPAASWASADDPRVTRIGRFLRKSRLDELPQMINVLRGEMSLVGPRPEQLAIFRRLDAAIPLYAERTYGVRPGITGFAQVNQGYDRTLDDVRAKLSYDHAYALALSRPRAWLALELRILARTVLVMAQGAGQ